MIEKPCDSPVRYFDPPLYKSERGALIDMLRPQEEQVPATSCHSNHCLLTVQPTKVTLLQCHLYSVCHQSLLGLQGPWSARKIYSIF